MGLSVCARIPASSSVTANVAEFPRESRQPDAIRLDYRRTARSLAIRTRLLRVGHGTPVCDTARRGTAMRSIAGRLRVRGWAHVRTLIHSFGEYVPRKSLHREHLRRRGTRGTTRYRGRMITLSNSLSRSYLRQKRPKHAKSNTSARSRMINKHSHAKR
jgi:hypothetical protein